MLIADSSFLIAFFDINDSQHTRAILDMAKAEEEEESFLVNNLVIQKLLTLHNTRYKQKSFFHYFSTAIIDAQSSNMFFKVQTKDEFVEVSKMILHGRVNNLSFIDLSLIVDTKSKKSGKLLTYDQNLYKYAKSIDIPVFNSVKFKVKYDSSKL